MPIFTHDVSTIVYWWIAVADSSSRFVVQMDSIDVVIVHLFQVWLWIEYRQTDSMFETLFF